jgi:hypothetical protein
MIKKALVSMIFVTTCLTPLMAGETNSVPPPFRVQVKSLSVRTQPNALSDVVTNLPFATVVDVVEKSNGWIRIEEGWVHSSGISRATKSTNAPAASVEDFEAAVGIVMKQLTNGVGNTITNGK